MIVRIEMSTSAWNRLAAAIGVHDALLPPIARNLSPVSSLGASVRDMLATPGSSRRSLEFDRSTLPKWRKAIASSVQALENNQFAADVIDRRQRGDAAEALRQFDTYMGQGLVLQGEDVTYHVLTAEVLSPRPGTSTDNRDN